jgi:hypothetical protein
MAEFKEPLHALEGTAHPSPGPLPTAADLGFAARAQSDEWNAAAPAAMASTHGGEATEDTLPAPDDTPLVAAPNDRWQTIERLLNKSALGLTALQRYRQYAVVIEYQTGTGSYYNSNHNKLTLDTTETAEEAALTFVHEMHHAHLRNAGLRADIYTMARDAYVQKKLEEEVDGTVLSIEAKAEIITAGEAIAATFPLEEDYRTAYEAAKQAGKSDDECRQAGRAQVMIGFQNGDVQTSHSGHSYPEYYGMLWDRAHPSVHGGPAR